MTSLGDGEVSEKKKPKPYVAVLWEGEVRFGRMVSEGLQEWIPTTKGNLRKGKKVWTVDKNPMYELRPEQIMETVELGGCPAGIAENFFPDPRGWRLKGVDVDLDRVVVKLLTRALAGIIHVPPSCLAAWASRIGELPWDIGERYNNRLKPLTRVAQPYPTHQKTEILAW